jgi:enamine deaminase RidA (YjgF/YER057c/UK114 family)
MLLDGCIADDMELSFRQQLVRAASNLAQVLRSVNSSLRQVLTCTVFIDTSHELGASVSTHGQAYIVRVLEQLFEQNAGVVLSQEPSDAASDWNSQDEETPEADGVLTNAVRPCTCKGMYADQPL